MMHLFNSLLQQSYPLRLELSALSFPLKQGHYIQLCPHVSSTLPPSDC